MKYFRWNGHGNTIMEKVADFYRNQVNTDCVFIVGSDKIHGHQVILNACSNYFQRILKSKTGVKEICLNNMKFCDLKSVLDFIYFGNVELPDNQVASFMKTAELLEIIDIQGTKDVQKLKDVPAIVESVSDDPLPLSNLNLIQEKSQIEKGENVLEIIKMKETVLEDEVCNVEEIVSDKALDGDTNFHSMLDLRFGEDNLRESAFLSCDGGRQSNLNDEIADDSSVDVYDDSLFHSEVIIKSEDDCMGESQVPLHSEDVLDTAVGDAAFRRSYSESKPKRQKSCREAVFACNHCDDPAAENESFTRHHRIHTELSCNEVNAALQKHPGGKPHQCQFCSASFTLLRHLKRHTLIHSGEKRFVCNVCRSAFILSEQLKVHARVHTGEKPYVCDICSSSFSQLGNLRRHKRVHSGEMPYVCDMCPSSFSEPGNLKRHKRIHSGEMPYVCNICSSAFSRWGNLKRHKRVHSSEVSFVCEICSSSFSRLDELDAHKCKH